MKIDWEHYDDVCDELILEDAIKEIAEGVELTIIKKDIVQDSEMWHPQYYPPKTQP